MSESAVPMLPTGEEIAKLPRWAQVAFAARCARRVQPLFQRAWPQASDRQVAAVDAAARLAELSAASARPVDGYVRHDIHLNAQEIIDTTRGAAADAGDAYAARWAASAAMHAARTVSSAKWHSGASRMPRSVALAAKYASSAADAFLPDIAYPAAIRAVNAALRRDFDHLVAAAERQKWNNDSPAPPDICGPMWPDGEPEGWPIGIGRPQRSATGTPSEQEITDLPRWAQVAFAARCARRVQPLYTHYWPEAPQQHSHEIELAITLAEQSASSARVEPNAAEAARAAGNAFAATPRPVASAVSIGAQAAAQAAALSDGKHAARVAKAATVASSIAGSTAADSDPSAAGIRAMPNSAAQQSSEAVRWDFELLKIAAERENWTDETPVPPEFFGPLWPEGEPERWPDEGREPRAGDAELVLEVDVPEGASDDDVVKLVGDLSDGMDDVHRAYGGDGLRIKRIEIEQESLVCAGVTP